MIDMALLSDATVQALGWMLLHFLWQGVAVAVVVAMLRIATRAPGLRYGTACAALLVMVLLPLGTFLSHRADTPLGPSLLSQANQVLPAGQQPASTPAWGFDTATPTASLLPLHQNWPAALTAYWQRHVPSIVLCWLFGVLVLNLRLLGGGWVSHRLRHKSTSPLPDHWQARVRALAQRQGIRHGVRVVTSTIAAVPMVVGVFRPVVLVPVATLVGLTQQQLEAILIHEFAHVRRYDNLVNLLQRLVEAVFFFHPAVWWLSSCIRTEREHCCDDAVVAGSDPKAYVAALATLEEHRNPSLVAATTGGPLLARVRRLLALDGSTARAANFTISGIIGILVVLAVAVAAIEATQSTKLTKEEMVAESEGTGSRKVLDIERSRVFTRLGSALHDMLQAAGRSEWSPPRLEGVLGNAFSFEMRKGGGMVWQEGNLDWWLFFEEKPEFELRSRIQRYQVRPGDDSGDVERIKAAAWRAARASIDRGVPATAWCPMQPKKDAPRDWGLLVGYDTVDETYMIRRHGAEFAVRFDEIGHLEPPKTFCVLVYEGADPDGVADIHIEALQNALAFANGTRYDPKEAAFHVDARGFTAFELWREAIESGSQAVPEQNHPRSNGIIDDSHYHSGELRALRGYAAAYLRELVDLLPGAAFELEKGAAHYDKVVGAADELQSVFGRAREEGALTAETRDEAGDQITAALEAERAAIANIEAALALLGDPAVSVAAVEGIHVADVAHEKEVSSMTGPEGGRVVQLNIEAEEGGGMGGMMFVGCLRPALRAASLDLSIDYLMGFLGTAFAFSMKESGGHLHQAMNYEWSYFFDMLDFLEHEAIDVSLHRIPGGGSGEPPPEQVVSVEEHTRAKAVAWEKVRRAIDEGYPAVAWQVMSNETRSKANEQPVPWLWSLIIGYDEQAGTYTVDNSGAGRFTIPWDGFGHSDPVNWFSVIIFKPMTTPFDAAAGRVAIRRAVESSEGKYPGDDAPAQGLAAWELWLAAFRDGTVEVNPVSHHAEYLIRARSAAAAFLREVQPHLPATASTPLQSAATDYDEVVARIGELRELCESEDPDLQRGAQILERAFEAERAAVAKLREVLDRS